MDNATSDGSFCPLGTFSHVPGSTICLNCLAGKSHIQNGATSPNLCMPCGVGKYINLTVNGTKCELCPINRAGSTAVSDCLDCNLKHRGTH